MLNWLFDAALKLAGVIAIFVIIAIIVAFIFGVASPP